MPSTDTFDDAKVPEGLRLPVIKGNNMIINRLTESANENCKDTTVDFLKKLVPEVIDCTITLFGGEG